MIKRTTFLSNIFLLLLSLSSILCADTPFFMVNKKGHTFRYNVDYDTTGQCIAVWDDYRYTSDVNLIGTEGGSAIFVKKFDIEGNDIGSEKRIDRKNDLSISNTRPDIAINKNNGEITIVWQERSEKSDGSRISRIIFNIFDNNFHKKVFQSPLNEVDSIYQGLPEVIYLENNNILIAWIENDGRANYYAAVLDQYGTKVRDRFLVSTNTISTNSAQFDKTTDGFYFVWGSYIQFYDNSGNLTTEIINGPFEDANAVKSINEDSILIVQRNPPYIQNLYGYFYNINDSTFSLPFRIDDDTNSSKIYSPFINANKNGEFIVIWEDFRNGSQSYYWITDTYTQRYNSYGQAIGNNFKINHESKEINQSHPKVILFDDHIIATYIEAETISKNDEFPELSKSRGYIAGTSQNFYDPIPGRIFGWEYLFDLVYTVGNPYPNPFINTFGYSLVKIDFDKESLLSYDIYNIIGDKIFESSSKLLLEGEYTLTWNGETNCGEKVSSGVYIWVIHLEDNVITRKSTYIK